MQLATDSPNRHARRAAKIPSPTAFSYTVADTCRMTGFGPTTAYDLLKKGHIRGLKVGNRRLICGASLRAYLASLGADVDKAA